MVCGLQEVIHLYDYMKALYLRFKTPSGQLESLELEIDKLHKQLSQRLKKPERKMLLRLTDLEAELRDDSNLYSFISGYRVANGIHQELSRHPPYNFEDEDERLACEKIRNEKDEPNSV